MTQNAKDLKRLKFGPRTKYWRVWESTGRSLSHLWKFLYHWSYVILNYSKHFFHFALVIFLLGVSEPNITISLMISSMSKVDNSDSLLMLISDVVREFWKRTWKKVLFLHKQIIYELHREKKQREVRRKGEIISRGVDVPIINN